MDALISYSNRRNAQGEQTGRSLASIAQYDTENVLFIAKSTSTTLVENRVVMVGLCPSMIGDHLTY